MSNPGIFKNRSLPAVAALRKPIAHSRHCMVVGLATVFAFCASIPARANIYEWAYNDPKDPAQGKHQSSKVTSGGSGLYVWHYDVVGKVNLTKGYFEKANLTRTVFLGTKLVQADFVGATLAWTDFDYANVAMATFDDADITGAFFGEAKGFTKEQLYSTASYKNKDLTRVHFNKAKLDGWDFTDQNISGADFSAATGLTRKLFESTASWKNKDLTGISLYKGNVTGWDFTGQVIAGANLSEAKGFTKDQLYSTASYQSGNLTGIRLCSNDLSGCNFKEKDLAAADFLKSKLAGANFSNANLIKATFWYTPVNNTDFTDANLTSAVFQYAKLSSVNFTSANLTAVGFQNAKLSGVNFTNANLSSGEFSKAKIDNANFTNANLTRANFGKTQLSRVMLDFADSRGSTGSKTGALVPMTFKATGRNFIKPNGSIDGFDLASGETMRIWDYDPTWGGARVDILVGGHFTMAESSKLRLVFEDSDWGSLIKMGKIDVSLGGTLELALSDGATPTLIGGAGAIIHLFDWTSASSVTGKFSSISLTGDYQGFTLDTSSLYTDGTITLIEPPSNSVAVQQPKSLALLQDTGTFTAVPEPGTLTLAGLAGSVLAMVCLRNKARRNLSHVRRVQSATMNDAGPQLISSLAVIRSRKLARLAVLLGFAFTPALVPAATPTPTSSPVSVVSAMFSGLVGDGQTGTGTTADMQSFFYGNGFLTLTTKSDSSFTGSLRLEGKTLAIKGKFDAQGVATSLPIKFTGGRTAQVVLNYNSAPPLSITGNVTTTANATIAAATLPFEALAGTNAGANLRYTIALPAPGTSSATPSGHGYATLVVTAKGLGTFAGKLADGTPFTMTSHFSDNGNGAWVLSVYLPLYSSGGMICGNIHISKTEPVDSAVVTGDLKWLRPANAKATMFSSGFLTSLSPLGEKYQLEKNISLLTGNGTTGYFLLELDPTGAGLTQAGTWAKSNIPALTKPVPVGMRLTLTGATGVIKGAFKRVIGAKSVNTAFEGVVLANPIALSKATDPVRATGFYLTGNNSLLVEIQDQAAPTPTPTPSEIMVAVQGGTLPPASALSGTAVTAFSISNHEVTWAEWQAVRTYAVANGYDLTNVGEGSAATNPVTQVCWYDVIKWCNAKSEQNGLTPVYTVNGAVYRSGQSVPIVNAVANGYRLPTEAEWEWAARGGVSSLGYTYSGSNIVNAVAWYAGNSGYLTHPVEAKAANELGIYDMSGNVWEWCWDISDPQDVSPSLRRLRGGCFSYAADTCTLARNYFDQQNPDYRNWVIGFRCARSSVP